MRKEPCKSLAMSFSFLLLLILSFLPSHSSSTARKQQEQKLSSFSISNSPWSPSMNRNLVSKNLTFAAGFLPSPNSPQLYFFSVWYLNSLDKTIIWSLNSPVNRSSSLIILPNGTLQLKDSTGKNSWQPIASANPNKSSLVLGEDGNLVYGSWNSFDNPTDTILPNQAIDGKRLVSKNGNYIFRDSKQLVFKTSSVYRTLDLAIQKLSSNGIMDRDNGDPLVMSDLGSNSLRRLTLDDDGNLRAYSLDIGLGTWKVVWQAVGELCEIYGRCGENYICMSNGSTSSFCVCPPGFQVQRTNNGEICRRKIPLRQQDSKFLQLDYVYFKDQTNQIEIESPNFITCKSGCVDNPRCLAFTFKYDASNSKNRQSCIYQLDHLLYGYWSPWPERVMFLRVSDSENSTSNFTGMATKVKTICSTLISLPIPPKESNTTTRNIAILSIVFAAELIIGFLSFWAFLKKHIKYREMAQMLGLELLPMGGPKRFSYSELKAATNNFSNIIGSGGFGIVYKGELSDHRIVAVKRLKEVAHGETEFWAEVTIIARMHHLNLVRLWGFCADKGQRMLVYEYIPNGSLAHFLFPANQSQNVQLRPILDWEIRYRIAIGVARAIAYLHEECLEWVLHCDIKPENILLEDDFCPKVSDFGLAKLTKKEDIVSMSRIRGTRGYLAPEWGKSEPITAKADVYSFGLVLLEIVGGKRNFEFHWSSVESWEVYFPRLVFEKVYEEERLEDLLDSRIKHCYDSRIHFELVDRMVKTAMWCLQERPEVRPSMGKVAKMLEGTVEIIEPPKPTIFYLGDG